MCSHDRRHQQKQRRAHRNPRQGKQDVHSAFYPHPSRPHGRGYACLFVSSVYNSILHSFFASPFRPSPPQTSRQGERARSATGFFKSLKESGFGLFSCYFITGFSQYIANIRIFFELVMRQSRRPHVKKTRNRPGTALRRRPSGRSQKGFCTSSEFWYFLISGEKV